MPARSEDFERLPIGAPVRIAPNHACMPAAAHERYHVVEGGTEIVAVWGALQRLVAPARRLRLTKPPDYPLVSFAPEGGRGAPGRA